MLLSGRNFTVIHSMVAVNKKMVIMFFPFLKDFFFLLHRFVSALEEG